MTIGFIGYGEAAYEISSGLMHEGVDRMVAFDRNIRGRIVRERAMQANVSLLPSLQEVISCSDIIVILVPPSVAYPVGKKVMRYCKTTQLYIDATAASPKVKTRIEKEAKKYGVKFADIAMMGVVKNYQHKVPIYASGEGAVPFRDSMKSYGMQITVVGEAAGVASKIKLVRSLFLKGIAAIVWEGIETAICLGVDEKVIPGVCMTLNSFTAEETFARLCIGTSLHCKRRAAELRGCAAMLREAHIDCTMAKATCRKLNIVKRKNWISSLWDNHDNDLCEVIKVFSCYLGGNYERVQLYKRNVDVDVHNKC